MPIPYDTPDAELEEIVAYLDGELSSEASARVERRLASDEDYRQQLQGIERAWHVLDELPMATVDDRFSRTTMSLVIEAAQDELQTKRRKAPLARWRRWASTALAAGVAAALGFLTFRLAWHDPNAPLVADLAVIDNVDLYSQFRDVQFLRDLESALGPDLQALSGDPRDLSIREVHFASVASPSSGEEWLEKLSPDERSNLRAKFNRFRELPEREQQRLRDLHREILTANDSAQLQRTMLAYQQWLGGLSPVRQFELRNMKYAGDRIEQIRQWADDMRDDELLTLTDAELKSLFGQLGSALEQLRKSLPPHPRRDDKREQIKLWLVREYGPLRRALVDQFDDRGSRDWFYAAVLEALPERSRERFEGLSPHEKVERFLTWMRQHTACRGEVSQQDLETFFAEELDAETQAQLLALPSDEMEQKLRHMFRCQPKSAADGRLMWQDPIMRPGEPAPIGFGGPPPGEQGPGGPPEFDRPGRRPRDRDDWGDDRRRDGRPPRDHDDDGHGDHDR